MPCDVSIFFFWIFSQDAGEVRIPITQGIAGHVATTGRKNFVVLLCWFWLCLMVFDEEGT